MDGFMRDRGVQKEVGYSKPCPRAGLFCLTHTKGTALANNLYFNPLRFGFRDPKYDNRNLRLQFHSWRHWNPGMLDEDRDNNPYLQQEVLAASPIRLRWMLITRAKELCEGVETLWRDGQIALGDQWSIRIRDILGELLSGVANGNPASDKVADFYLFLLKMLSEVEQTRDLDRLACLKDLLAYEAETWQLLLQKPVSEDCAPAIPMITPLRTHLPAPISSNYGDSDDFSSGSSFSLDV